MGVDVLGNVGPDEFVWGAVEWGGTGSRVTWCGQWAVGSGQWAVVSRQLSGLRWAVF